MAAVRRLANRGKGTRQTRRSPTHSRHYTKLRTQKKRLQSWSGRRCAFSFGSPNPVTELAATGAHYLSNYLNARPAIVRMLAAHRRERYNHRVHAELLSLKIIPLCSAGPASQLTQGSPPAEQRLTKPRRNAKVKTTNFALLEKNSQQITQIKSDSLIDSF